MKAWIRHTLKLCKKWLSEHCCAGSTVENDVIAEDRYARRGRVIASFLCSCGRGENVIPSPKWRREHGRWVSIGPDGAQAFRQLLESQLDEESPYSVPKLRTFDLHGLRIGNEGIRALCPIFEVDKSISTLILSGNGITDAGISVLLKHLSKGPSSLRVLSLVGNPVTSRGIKFALSSFTSLTFSIEELSLSRGSIANDRKMKTPVVHSDSPITPVFLAEDVESFLKLLNRSDGNLKCFSYHGNHYADFGADDFGRILEAGICSQNIKHLILQECYTSQVSCPTATELTKTLAAPFELAAKALQSTSATLTTLELQVPLSDEAVSAFASGISSATCLVRLSLRGCYMSAEGLRIFSETALSSNCSIVSLDLSYQSEEVSHPLCDSQWMGRLLTGHVNSSISLSRRPLLPVFRALNSNCTLEELEVVGIDILPDDVEELCACIESGRNTVIRSVKSSELSSDPLSIKLESLLARNRNMMRHSSRTVEATRRSPVIDIPWGVADVAGDENQNAEDNARGERLALPPKQQSQPQSPHQQQQQQWGSIKKLETHSHSRPDSPSEQSLSHDTVSPCYLDIHKRNTFVDFARQDGTTYCESTKSNYLSHTTSAEASLHKDAQPPRRRKVSWGCFSVRNNTFSPRSETSVSCMVSP